MTVRRGVKMAPAFIKSPEEHEVALARIDAPMNATPGTLEGDELELWVSLVDLYEREHFPIAPPDPIAATRFRMEQADLRASVEATPSS
jgi:HTH-type transcriptional regulator/antitoxin HigA